jgi:membrane protein implicated in regulation of membrane protease activity
VLAWVTAVMVLSALLKLSFARTSMVTGVPAWVLARIIERVSHRRDGNIQRRAALAVLRPSLTV